MDIKPTLYDRDYEITDAMFGAFRSTGGVSFFWTLMGWGTLMFSVINLIFLPMIIGDYFDFVQSAFLFESDPDLASETAGDFLGQVARFMVVATVWLVVYVAGMAVLRAAFFRGYFFGDVGEKIPLQFGSDELRQGAAILGFYALFVFGAVIIGTVMVVLIGSVAIISNGQGAILFILVIVLLYIAMIVGMIWFGVRFCCAGALTALTRRTQVVNARHVSRNRFWALFGALIVAGLIGYVVSYITQTTAMLMAFSMLDMGDVFALFSGIGDPEDIVDIIDRATNGVSFKISSLLAIVVLSAGYTFYTLMIAGPQAFFTKQWAEAGDLDLLGRPDLDQT